MNTPQRIAIGLAAMAAAIAAPASEVDRVRKVEIPCGSDGVGRAAIASAVGSSGYWAPQSARRRMLSLARHACSLGATVVTFLPPPEPRPCRSPPAWSTFCVEETAALHALADRSTAPNPPASE